MKIINILTLITLTSAVYAIPIIEAENTSLPKKEKSVKCNNNEVEDKVKPIFISDVNKIIKANSINENENILESRRFKSAKKGVKKSRNINEEIEDEEDEKLVKRKAPKFRRKAPKFKRKAPKFRRKAPKFRREEIESFPEYGRILEEKGHLQRLKLNINSSKEKREEPESDPLPIPEYGSLIEEKGYLPKLKLNIKTIKEKREESESDPLPIPEKRDESESDPLPIPEKRDESESDPLPIPEYGRLLEEKGHLQRLKFNIKTTKEKRGNPIRTWRRSPDDQTIKPDLETLPIPEYGRLLEEKGYLPRLKLNIKTNKEKREEPESDPLPIPEYGRLLEEKGHLQRLKLNINSSKDKRERDDETRLMTRSKLSMKKY